MFIVIYIFSILRLLQALPQSLSPQRDQRPACPCSENKNVDYRVVNGGNVRYGFLPYACALVYRGDWKTDLDIDLNPFCGATLISDRHVLTAAHCLKDKGPLDVSVAVNDYSLRDPRDGGVVIHSRKFSRYPDYASPSFHSDIAVIELVKPVPWHFGRGIRTAYLPPRNLRLEPGTEVHVYGWGRLSFDGGHPDILQAADMPVVDNDECQTKFFSTIEDTMLCAGGVDGKDACIGDSGSGLIVRLNNEFVLCGVVSFGRKCALPEVPGVYTQVSSFLDWILQETQSSECRPCIFGED